APPTTAPHKAKTVTVTGLSLRFIFVSFALSVGVSRIRAIPRVENILVARMFAELQVSPPVAPEAPRCLPRKRPCAGCRVFQREGPRQNRRRHNGRLVTSPLAFARAAPSGSCFG